MTINERLKQLRLECGMTQTELAKALKIGQSTVAAYESSHDPNVYNLIAYAKFFGCSLDYLAGLEAENFAPSYLVGEKERELLLRFRRLKPASKDYILETILSLLNSPLNL